MPKILTDLTITCEGQLSQSLQCFRFDKIGNFSIMHPNPVHTTKCIAMYTTSNIWDGLLLFTRL